MIEPDDEVPPESASAPGGGSPSWLTLPFVMGSLTVSVAVAIPAVYLAKLQSPWWAAACLPTIVGMAVLTVALWSGAGNFDR